MASAHFGLGIRSDHFDRVVSHLADSLRSSGVEPEAIDQIGSALVPLKPAVVES